MKICYMSSIKLTFVLFFSFEDIIFINIKVAVWKVFYA